MVVTEATDADCYAQSVVKFKRMQGHLAWKTISLNELSPPNLADITVKFYTMIRFDSFKAW